MEGQIPSLGLGFGKEEDINTLYNTIGKAQSKGSKAFGDLMWAWEDLEQVVTRVGRNQDVTDRMIEALAAVCAWGRGEQLREQLRRKKFETYLEHLLWSAGRTLGQAVAQACTPARTPARTPAASTQPESVTSMTIQRRPVQSP